MNKKEFSDNLRQGMAWGALMAIFGGGLTLPLFGLAVLFGLGKRQQPQKPEQREQQPPARPPVLDPEGKLTRDALRRIESINRDIEGAKNRAALERAYRMSRHSRGH